MRVLQLIDSLEAGGAERVAVNLANILSDKIDRSFLCTTRKEGLLKNSLVESVGYLFLNKQKTIDLSAIKSLNTFIKANKINIIHAHSSSFFLATIIKILNNKVSVIWHDHYGDSEFLKKRKFGVLKHCSKYFSHVFSVNKTLESWAKQKLKLKNVTYLPNFASIDDNIPVTKLKGVSGKRIVCLANLRKQKDHITLINAFKEVHAHYPDWTLHCVGKNFNDDHAKLIENKIKVIDLVDSIFLYDSKPDIYNILCQCEIGVLSSKSEGLPLALLEYGLSNLAVIATKVGDCETVITNQTNGILVKARSSNEMARAIVCYIENLELRNTFAYRYNQHIKKNYSVQGQIEHILKTYKTYIK